MTYEVSQIGNFVQHPVRLLHCSCISVFGFSFQTFRSPVNMHRVTSHSSDSLTNLSPICDLVCSFMTFGRIIIGFFD